MLSMSLVTRLRMSPREWSSKYLSGSRASFCVDLVAQPVDDPLGDAGHEVCLHPAEDSAEEVEADEPRRRMLASGVEVDAGAGHDGHAAEHVGELGLALGALSPPRPAACVTPAGSCCADDALEQHVGGVAQDLGPDDANATLTTARTRTTSDTRRARAAAGPSRRRNDLPKSFDFSGGRLPIIMPPGPHAARPPLRRSGAALAGPLMPPPPSVSCE